MTPTSQEHHMTTTDIEPTRWRWNTAAAGRPSIDRVRASVNDAHAALRAYAERDNVEQEADRG